MNLTLEIPVIFLDIFIGYFDEEQTQKSPVEISIIAKYKNLPKLCIDDDLDLNPEKNLRYDFLIDALVNFCENKSFRTVEKWCYEIFQFLVETYNLNKILSNFILRFTKKNILTDRVPQGVTFILEESF